MVKKADQQRIKALLTEAITVLCKNGLSYEYNCGIQGLLGITLDDEDVFLVDIKESIVKATRPEPEEETETPSTQETSSEPQSPAQVSSPGARSRRRRRRKSSEENGASPAKKAAHSSLDQSSDDVIVIKEETENETLQMYCESGGGNSDQVPQDDSYNMAYQQDSGDYGGAGCSQWDTSSSSSQQTWSQQQQQDLQQQMSQYEASQQHTSTSAATALMSPTQVLESGSYEWEGATPRVTLTSPTIRNTLSQALVYPTFAKGSSVTAVRLSWFANDAEEVKPYWENLASMRVELDNRVKTVPGIQYFVSCLTSTVSGRKKKIAFPGVSYWIVSEQPVSAVNLTAAFEDKLGATLKLLIQPYQSTPEHTEQVLYTVAKDCTEGVVKKVLDRLAGSRGKGKPAAITKIYTPFKLEKAWLDTAAFQLRELRATVDVELY